MNGIVVAVAFTVIAGAVGLLYLRSTGALEKVGTLDSVVVVLAATGEDAELAGVVALVTKGGTDVRIFDPLKEVTIAGTSYSKLRDAYPFGGAQAVAAALKAEAGEKASWVDVPQATWVAALEAAAETSAGASGATGVSVTLPKAIEVFDGQRLAWFPEGTCTVPAADVALLLRGVGYLPTAARIAVVEQVGAAALAALAEHPGQGGITTNLTPQALTHLLKQLRER